MEIKDFNQLLLEGCKEIGIKLQERQMSQFYKYMELLLEWNQKMNLTAIVEEKEVILKHFIDSLTTAKQVKGNEKIIDVGTGAGFPGIPIKIVFPEIEITLLDSLQKRTIFLKEVVETLELQNVEIIHGRAEEYGIKGKFREQYDIAVSRAVASLEVLSEYMIPFVKLNGFCIIMKGPNIEEELENSKKIIEILGGKIENIEEFILPKSDLKRNIIIIKKQKNTLKQYPRRGLNSKKKTR